MGIDLGRGGVACFNSRIHTAKIYTNTQIMFDTSIARA